MSVGFVVLAIISAIAGGMTFGALHGAWSALKAFTCFGMLAPILIAAIKLAVFVAHEKTAGRVKLYPDNIP
jgi:uncharacterized membrane protein YeiH